MGALLSPAGTPRVLWKGRSNGKEPITSSGFRLGRLAAAAVTTIGAAVVLAGFPGLGEAGAVQDADGIQALLGDYLTAWNAHDPSGLAAFFSEDADLVMGNLPAVRGRSEIRDWWHEYFSRQEPERRLTLDVGPMRRVAADVAAISVVTTTGGRSGDGQELRERRFRGTWLLHRQHGTWRISAMRGLPLEEDRVILNDSLETTEALRPDIRAFVAAYGDALNTHDPAAVSAFYRDDAEIIVRNSPPVRGRTAIQEWWRAHFAEPRPYRAVLIIDEIRIIAPDVALINVIGTGAFPQPEGERLPIRYARATWIVVREDGEWLVSSLWVLPSEEDHIIRSDAH